MVTVPSRNRNGPEGPCTLSAGQRGMVRVAFFNVASAIRPSGGRDVGGLLLGVADGGVMAGDAGSSPRHWCVASVARYGRTPVIATTTYPKSANGLATTIAGQPSVASAPRLAAG
jgi:hypothetical protein